MISGDAGPNKDQLIEMPDEREAMGSHEAQQQPVHKEFTFIGSTSADDDSLDALAREMEAAGHPKWAARLSILARDLDPYLLPQMPVSAPVPEPRLPELHGQEDA